jgi:hypothetical protein
MTYTPPVLPASGTTFAQFQAGGITAMLDRLIGLVIAGGTTPTRISLLRAAKQGNLQPVFKKLTTMAAEWNSGHPMPTANVATNLGDLHIVFMALAQCCQEAGVLMDANPGTLSKKATPLNVARDVRTWP